MWRGFAETAEEFGLGSAELRAQGGDVNGHGR